MRASPRRPAWLAAAALAAAAAGAGACSDGSGPSNAAPADSFLVPISQLINLTYRGFSGGLYPASNDPPPAHLAEAQARARAVTPRDTAGRPDPAGRYVLVSIGMSNTTQEFCSATGNPPCNAWTFMGQAAADSAVNHTSLVIVNGAAGGQDAATWESPSGANYDRIRDTRLAPLGLSEKQVELAWVKVANAQPTKRLPDRGADAYILERRMGNIVRALKMRYPNLTLVYLSSRIFGGYATTPLNPEPYAYESGFAVKWLIQAQIEQMAAGAIRDTLAGNLDYRTVAPWIGWGPYLWTLGDTQRSDGLQWFRSDFEGDGTHPSPSGERKVADLLMDFFRNSTFARCWFLRGATCP